MTRWVVDASPLIFLAKLDSLHLLRDAASEIFIASEVVREISAYDDEASARTQAALGTWLLEETVADLELSKLLKSEIGAGEAETIALAAKLRAEMVVLDDLDARRWARRLDLEIIGTLGLLLAARLRGEIPSLNQAVERLLDAGFRVSDGLLEAVLAEAGEQKLG